ncbi:SCP2 sterol-binding domain-containing protein [Cubamyces menziesii]|nr:SCP2 sterol-binding domain-containing protein [Cubamyces menziesii]
MPRGSRPYAPSSTLQIGGIYEIHLTNSRRQAAIWTIDLKSTGTVLKGSFRTADVVITTSDETFVDIANGRVSPLKAFQTGKLNTRGNIALVNKLDSVGYRSSTQLARAGARK